jgi:hypothetical protein
MLTFVKADLLAIAAVVGSTCACHAVDYPYKLHQEQNIDTHQVGWVDLTIDPQGNGSLIDGWSNGKHTSGNTFYAIVVLVGKDGKVVWSNKQTKGLDGSWGGHARRGYASANFTLSKEQMEMFDHVALKMGAMNCGMDLSSFSCCDHGIDVGFSSKKCNVPATPRPTVGHQVK